MCYTFFIHVSECTRCFCILTIIDAAVNVVGQICFQVSVFIFFRKIPRSGIAPIVVLFLIFWGITKLFPTVATPVSIPTNSAQGSLLPTSSPNPSQWNSAQGSPLPTSSPKLAVSCLFSDGHHGPSERCEVTSYCEYSVQNMDSVSPGGD